MATAKSAAKSSKKPGTALATWDEALAQRAQIAKKAESSVATSEFLSLKGGQLTFRNNVVPGNKMNVIVLASRLENQFFEGEYDPNTPASPVCFAFGQDDETMKPHEKSPAIQHPTCDGCNWNEFGSADKGRGKACKNVRRLSLIPADCLDNGPDAVKDEQSAFLKVPVMSVKAWASYVQQLATMNRPPLAFVTEISVTPDPVAQFKVSFRAVERIEDGDLLGALLERADKAEAHIETPYIAMEAPVAPPRNGRGAAAKSKVRGAAGPQRTAASRGAAPAPAAPPDIPVRARGGKAAAPAAKTPAKKAPAAKKAVTPPAAEVPVRAAAKKSGGAAARKF